MSTATIGTLDEVFLGAKDLTRMRDFYVDVLGLEEEFRHEKEMVGLRTGGAALVLTDSEHGSSGVSLVFACTDIRQTLDDLTRKGVVVTQPVWEGHWGALVAGFEDPEGNTIHLEQPSEPADHHH